MLFDPSFGGGGWFGSGSELPGSWPTEGSGWGGFQLPDLSFQTGGGGSGGGAGITEGDVKVMATQIVEQAEREMAANLEAWRTGSRSKTEALRVFDQWFAWMSQNLQALGAVGARSLAERSRGGIYPYPVWYRDPIAGSGAGGDPVYDIGTVFTTDVFGSPLSIPWWVLAVMAGALLWVWRKRRRG